MKVRTTIWIDEDVQKEGKHLAIKLEMSFSEMIEYFIKERKQKSSK